MPAPRGIALGELAMRSTSEDLASVAALVDAGGLTAEAGEVLDLSDVAAAIELARSASAPSAPVVRP
jgi:hypothetical protein